MARAVDMRVVTVRRLVLNMRRRNRDPALLLLRRLVNLVERNSVAAAASPKTFVIAAVNVVLPWST